MLESGRSREEVVEWLIAQRGDTLVAGLDFAFSFPAWYCARRGWRTGPEVWAGVAGEPGETLLREESPPFWGRSRTRPTLDPGRPQLRRTDASLASKSVFQIGGAGAVGTGSIRGMECLARLRAAGFSVWPFDEPARAPLLLEIYPRACYGLGRVVKSRWRSRHDALARWFPDHPRALLERAAGSEDAFDAAVSALVMSAHADALSALPACPEGSLEGWVWRPPATPEP